MCLKILKDNLRKEIKARLNSLTPALKEEQSHNVFEQVRKHSYSTAGVPLPHFRIQRKTANFAVF